jgi:hypothetical protein
MKRHWLWNIVIVITVVVCIAAFVLHSKTWIREETDKFSLISGFYSTEILYQDIEMVSMVPRIPEMERTSGFSAWTFEKGIFRDTLQALEGIRVYVDELNHPKIKLERREAAPVYFNFRDSLETLTFFEKLSERLNQESSQ